MVSLKPFPIKHLDAFRFALCWAPSKPHLPRSEVPRTRRWRTPGFIWNSNPGLGSLDNSCPPREVARAEKTAQKGAGTGTAVKPHLLGTAGSLQDAYIRRAGQRKNSGVNHEKEQPRDQGKHPWCSICRRGRCSTASSWGLGTPHPWLSGGKHCIRSLIDLASKIPQMSEPGLWKGCQSACHMWKEDKWLDLTDEMCHG